MLNLDRQIASVADQLQASGAVVILGAGFSWPAGIPLTAHLAPFVWQALDENPGVRAEVAAKFGEVDVSSQALLDHDEVRLVIAYDALREHPPARKSFQCAFAARDRSVLHQSAAHDALSRLFHSGTAEIVISFNWDTLFERCYARMYGRRPVVDDHFWKPHGDAGRPDQKWVLPGDPGRVPPELIEKVTALVRERPRLCLIVGYSESDERVAQMLTKPLAERWSVCRVGPAATGANAIRGSADEILSNLAARLVPEPQLPGWRFVGLSDSRGLGPALLGMPLGMADAGACPRLPEVSQLVAQLRTAHTARLVGPPGSGKSLCAFQSLMELSALGYDIVRPVSPIQEGSDLALAGHRFPLIVLIDDAHLAPASVLLRLQEIASERLLVLLASTEHEGTQGDRGSIQIDPQRAVRTIAQGLRTNLPLTLKAVRAVDDRVGNGWLDERIDERINEAERTAEFPWQFCFILGGGWRRASQAADAARAKRADLVLAAAAVRQLVSRDAQGEPEVVRVLATAGFVSPEDFDSAARWLVRERLLLSENDLRCPHQRLAAVVLDRIFQGLPSERRTHFLEICRSGLSDPHMPLLGVHALLDTLRFAESIRWVWDELITPGTEAILVARCLAANSSEQRMAAALVLTDVVGFSAGCPRRVLAEHSAELARWISAPNHPSGIGLARLINDLWNNDKELAREICEQVDVHALGAAVSGTLVSDAWAIGELLDRLRLAASDEWRTAFVATLDNEALLSKAMEWPEPEVEALSGLVAGIGTFSDELGLSMLEHAEPHLRRRLAASPLKGFRELNKAFFDFLHVWDPLGVFVGRLQPSPRARALARRLCRDIDPAILGVSISNASRHTLESYAHLLDFLAGISPRLHKAVVASIDVKCLDHIFEEHWSKLPHDLLVFACHLRVSRDHEPASSWIKRHSQRISTMATRLAILAPSVATEVVDRGGRIALDDSMAFEWLGISFVVDSIARERPDLVDQLLEPHVVKAAEMLARNQNNTYDDVDAFISVLAEHAPSALSRILEQIEPVRAEVAWAACLEGSATARRSAARLVDVALSHGGPLGEAAKRLRSRYPKASIPWAKLSIEVSRRHTPRRRARRRRRVG